MVIVPEHTPPTHPVGQGVKQLPQYCELEEVSASQPSTPFPLQSSHGELHVSWHALPPHMAVPWIAWQS